MKLQKLLQKVDLKIQDQLYESDFDKLVMNIDLKWVIAAGDQII